MYFCIGKNIKNCKLRGETWVMLLIGWNMCHPVNNVNNLLVYKPSLYLTPESSFIASVEIYHSQYYY